MNSLTALSKDLSTLVADVGQAVVAIHGNRYSASGIHWQQGLIVTSYESVNLEETLHVMLPDETVVEAEVLGSDPTTDVAILQLPQETALTVPPIADPNCLAVGNWVMGLGRSLESGIFASHGIIHSLGPAWRSSSGGMIDRRVRPDLNLSRQGAGGPLIDAEGNVIGFNTFGPRRSILTIPGNTVNRVLGQLREKGRVVRPYLGIGVQSIQIPQSLQSQLSTPVEFGLMVVSLEPDKAAEQAGILPGDIIVALDNTPMNESRAFQFFLASQTIGQSLTVQLIRGGQPQHISVIVGER